MAFTPVSTSSFVTVRRKSSSSCIVSANLAPWAELIHSSRRRSGRMPSFSIRSQSLSTRFWVSCTASM